MKRAVGLFLIVAVLMWGHLLLASIHGSAPTPNATIVLNWESSALAAPQSFRDNCQAAATALQSAIHNNITLNILVGYGDFNNGLITGITTGAQGGGLYGATSKSYTLIRSLLPQQSADQISFFNALPATSSIQGTTNFFVDAGVAKALGGMGIGPNDAPNDGAIGIGTAVPTANLIGVCLHEITHAIGREPSIPPWAFGKFTAVGTRVLDGSLVTAYFSVDNGTTKIADYDTSSDPSDFLNSGVQGTTDPFDASYNGSTQQSLTTADKRQMDISGFNVH